MGGKKKSDRKMKKTKKDHREENKGSNKDGCNSTKKHQEGVSGKCRFKDKGTRDYNVWLDEQDAEVTLNGYCPIRCELRWVLWCLTTM